MTAATRVEPVRSDAARSDSALLEPDARGLSDDALSDELLAPIWTTHRGWWPLLLVSGAGSLVLAFGVTYSVVRGVGVWGNNIPVAWGFPIINFVWWIGIGHAGTFISAFLYLLNQKWRASVNRIAEAMTLFALVNAGLFPLLHLGRPWFGYWLLPYPSTMGVWPNFKSALPWDMAAVATYFIVSLLFWYLGLVPDLALARDRAPTRGRARVYGVFALGWRGSADEWKLHRVAYTVLAALATPLVISVHSVVSFDFSITQLPGWHSAIFPPYFVAGAIYSGLAMVLVLLIPIRAVFHLENVITDEHLEKVAKLMLTTGMMLAYSYVVETFSAWYSGDQYERYTYLFNRPFGPLAWAYWITIALNVGTPQLFWFRAMRRNHVVLFGAGVAVLIGMWLERFMLIVTSLQRDFLPSSWHGYMPTWVDLSILGGSIAFFFFMMLLFLRFVPFVPVSEIKRLRFELKEEDARRSRAVHQPQSVTRA